MAVYALIKGMDAFTKENVLAQLASDVDERDAYLTMRSAHVVLKLTNYVLASAIFVCLLMYAAWQWSYGLIIAITLCGVEGYLFISFLWVNHRLEKKE